MSFILRKFHGSTTNQLQNLQQSFVMYVFDAIAYTRVYINLFINGHYHSRYQQKKHKRWFTQRSERWISFRPHCMPLVQQKTLSTTLLPTTWCILKKTWIIANNKETSPGRRVQHMSDSWFRQLLERAASSPARGSSLFPLVFFRLRLLLLPLSSRNISGRKNI